MRLVQDRENLAGPERVLNPSMPLQSLAALVHDVPKDARRPRVTGRDVVDLTYLFVLI